MKIIPKFIKSVAQNPASLFSDNWGKKAGSKAGSDCFDTQISAPIIKYAPKPNQSDGLLDTDFGDCEEFSCQTHAFW